MTETTNSADWLDGYHQALEDAATLVEKNQEQVNGDNSRVMRPRTKGNLMSIAYADAIRKLASEGL